LYFYLFYREVPKYPTTKQLDDKSQKQVRYIISLLITVLILPASILHTFNRRKKFQHQIDLFTDNEFSGIAILYKKTKFNQNPKLELGFLTKKI
jgi:hypothetical protein